MNSYFVKVKVHLSDSADHFPLFYFYKVQSPLYGDLGTGMSVVEINRSSRGQVCSRAL